MHGLTGGGWKRKRYRPRSKRKLPAGKPQAGAPRPTAEPFATAPATDPPTAIDDSSAQCHIKELRRNVIRSAVRLVGLAASRPNGTKDVRT